MIVTVSPNPSVDRTLHLSGLARGAVHRAHDEDVEPSGKGVNVALAVHRAGGDAVAVLPAGGHAGAHLVEMIGATGLRHHVLATAAETRTNVSLVEPDGTTTKINEAGPALSGAQFAGLGAAALDLTGPGDWVAWCGSLPPGVGPRALAQQVASCRRAGRRVALDSSGPALAAAVAGDRGGLPHLVKPNTEELAELCGRSLHTLDDVVAAARELVARGVETVLVSMGGDGAVLVSGDTVAYGIAAVDRVVNTAGAGDAFLAGYLVDDSSTPADRLDSALRFGAAAVLQPGTSFHPAAHVPTVTRVDPRSRNLHSPAAFQGAIP